MTEHCQIDELGTLFLFEHLADAQLEMLCAEGRIEILPPGPLFSEGARRRASTCGSTANW